MQQSNPLAGRAAVSRRDVASELRAAVAASIGALPEAVGRGALERAVTAVAADLGGTPDAVVDAARTDPQLVATIAGQLEPPRRWLHRHPAGVAVAVADARARSADGAATRVLCLGCGFGEEVWTLALAFDAAGPAIQDWEIDAVDVSRRAIAAARLAVLPSSAFRRDEDRVLCARVAGGHRLPEPLARRPRFVVGDGRDPAAWFDGRRYDIVVFRDVLVGADTGARGAWCEALDAVLAPGGLLLLGASDGRPEPLGRYVALPVDYAFAWRRRRGAAPACMLGAGLARGPRGDGLLRPVTPRSRPDPGADWSTLAGGCVERGELDRAISMARRRLANEPDAGDALAILARVAELQGDARGATELRARIGRSRRGRPG